MSIAGENLASQNTSPTRQRGTLPGASKIKPAVTGTGVATTLAALGAGSWLAIRAYRWLNQYDFRGRTTLVTGGSRGLGLILARRLAEEGARVAICARDQQELDRAYEDLARRADQVLAIPCDLAEREQVQEMIHVILDRWGPLDVLINNASTIGVGPVETMGLDDYERAMRNNFWSAVHTTLAVLPVMRRRGSGRIVNITSIGGKVSVPHLLPYSAAKFALVGWSEGLRSELLKDGITVTTVCPGLMRTGSPRQAEFKGQQQAEYTWFKLSDSLPGFSMSAERAARQILNACRRGDAEVVLSLPAKAAVLFHGLFPGLTADLLGLVNLVLPGADGAGTGGVQGKEIGAIHGPEWLTTLTDRAAERNNEIAPEERLTGTATRAE